MSERWQVVPELLMHVAAERQPALLQCGPWPVPRLVHQDPGAGGGGSRRVNPLQPHVILWNAPGHATSRSDMASLPTPLDGLEMPACQTATAASTRPGLILKTLSFRLHLVSNKWRTLADEQASGGWV